MPAVIERIHDPVVLVRELHADEEYVMTAFERHARHCSQCADPLEAYRQERTLCERGHQYAIDVAAYLFSKNGKVYSVVDRERGQPTLVKIPRDRTAVRLLLAAIEAGMRLKRDHARSPVISYDQTYPVSPRRTSAPAYQEIIEREPRAATATATKRRRVIVYTSPRSSPSRGSLYDWDAADRVERHYEPTRVYRPAEFYR